MRDPGEQSIPAEITYGERDGERLWALHGETMTYGLGVDRGGTLRHLYFGPRLAGPDDLPGMEEGQRSFEPPKAALTQEYPAWGGMYYREPCLKATFADGVRDARFIYEDHRVEEPSGLVVVLRDSVYDLRVFLHYRVLASEDLIERWTVVENTGEQPIVLEQVLSAVLHLPEDGYRLTHLAGAWVNETQVHEQRVTPGKKTLESRRGNTSHHANPWFALDRGDATEESGKVWFGALAWSGNWKIAVESDASGPPQVSGGINDFDFSWLLRGGETFETPAFVFGFSGGGFGGASRALHRHARERVLPGGAEEIRPVLYNSWEATFFDVSEDGQKELARRAAALGVELFVVDDGWFGERDDDTKGLGDWTVNRRKFPDGLGLLIEEVRGLGMGFGIWVEPEMVNPDSDLYREHPDWAYRFPTRPNTESRNQLVLNLATDEVREHVFGVLDQLLSENEISFVKWDMNRPFSEPGWPEAPERRQREVWVRHVHSVYEILRRLRERHPGVAFEACSGGGGRVDLGVLRYADQAWTSDNTDPYDRLRIQEGFSMAYPVRAMMCWVADAGEWVENRKAPLRYRFHSAMMGSLGIGGNLLRWSDSEMEEARQLVAEYKEVRHVVQNGDQFRLLSPRATDHDTTAVQYVARDGSESVVFVLKGFQRVSVPVPRVYPRGLEPGASYRIADAGKTLSGAAIMGGGISPDFDGDLQSSMVRIWKV